MEKQDIGMLHKEINKLTPKQILRILLMNDLIDICDKLGKTRTLRWLKEEAKIK